MAKAPSLKEIEYCRFLLERGRPIPAGLAAAGEIARRSMAPEPETEPEESLAEKAAAANRAKYPEIAAALDMVREFFPDARVVAILPNSDPGPATFR